MYQNDTERVRMIQRVVNLIWSKRWQEVYRNNGKMLRCNVLCLASWYGNCYICVWECKVFFDNRIWNWRPSKGRKIMDIKIDGKNELTGKFGVKPYRSPATLPEKDPMRAEIECTCKFTVKDVPDTFDLAQLPKVILLPFVKSIVIEEQTTLRSVPKDKTSVDEYRVHYSKLVETCKTVQTFEVTEAVERKSTGGKVQKALDLVNAKQTALNALVLKYTKYTAANLVEVMQRLEGCADVESVKSTQLAIATEAEKSNRK